MLNKRNITYSEFKEYCEKIKNILINNFNETSLLPPYQSDDNYYDNNDEGFNDLNNKREIIYLSNGDVFKYFVPKSCVAHILGVNTEYLNNTSLFSKKDSYGILLELIKDPYKYYQKYKEGFFDVNIAISPYINEKIDSFSKNVEININHCEFVCKYKKDRSYGYGQADMAYLALTKYDDKYYVLMLDEYKNDSNRFIYVPRSNRSYDSKEEVEDVLSSMLFNQELTMLNGKSIKMGYKDPLKVWVPNQDRIKKIDAINQWSKKLDCIPNVINDYRYLVNKFDSTKTDQFYQSDVLADISELMRNKKIIDINTSDLSSEVIEIINAYNDSLNYGENTENEVKFSDVLNEKKQLEQKLQEALKQNEELQSKYKEISQKYDDSVKENEQLSNKIENVRKALG